ncbi:amino acid ABC transporter permease [Dickeya oryzae]|uniref:Glutamate/aspartate import permease protein GltK n=1 Tax=Dickeya oryzae TaxID=1240404 RepID=A0AB39IRV3_9GAMM|nr:amino acid ABC transporter permease [Dickeya oryzae]MBP2850831.1 amino acid ABC transporter permease [Dickeya oryzae]MBP2859618.1 amino acid ABC transporter permease [Dickeya oryzae]MCA6992890.1 amino acid ABC transporter permease [Dickeya oryzae]MCA6995764.1 amino acid ABC transporter permease [Dickeya oryzae]
MNFSWEVFWQYLLKPSDVYLYGLWLTCIIAVSAMLLGSMLGLMAALLRLSASPLLRYPVGFYIWLMRGTPLLVQIVFLYTALAAGGLFHFQDITLGSLVIPGNIQAAVVALGLNEGAYMAEIIRSGLGAVDKGQYEAAKSLGMTFPRLMRRIILPQAFRVIIPSIGNEFNVMLKNTTLVSVIGVQELLLSTQMITSATFRVFELYTVVAIYFLVLTSLWGLFQYWLEKRFNQPHVRVSASSRLFGRQTMSLFGRQAMKTLRGR